MPRVVQALRRAALALLLALAWHAPLGAQQPAAVAAPRADSLLPPISAKRAFLYSVAIPGLGQSSLRRYRTGAGFFLVEAVALSLLHRSADDLRTAREFRGDSVPLTWATDPATGAVKLANGVPVAATWQKLGATDALIQARKLQVEDWVAIVIFNHLIAGTDAFVAAQLWDVPARVALRAVPLHGATGLGVSVGYR